jgi:hypothetical protein
LGRGKHASQKETERRAFVHSRRPFVPSHSKSIPLRPLKQTRSYDWHYEAFQAGQRQLRRRTPSPKIRARREVTDVEGVVERFRGFQAGQHEIGKRVDLLANPTPRVIVVMQQEVAKVFDFEVRETTHTAILHELDELLYEVSRPVGQSGQEQELLEHRMKLPPSPQIHQRRSGAAGSEVFVVSLHLARQEIAIHLAFHEDGKLVARDPSVGNAFISLVRARKKHAPRLEPGDAQKYAVPSVPRASYWKVASLQQKRDVPSIRNADFSKKGAAHVLAAGRQGVDQRLREVVLKLPLASVGV